MISEKCTGCGACRNVCPVNAITMDYNDKGFFTPVIDADKCIHCGKCEAVCPMITAYAPAKSILSAGFFINREEYYRGISSSGGFFHAAASEVIRRGGIVFGVKIGKDFSIYHASAETEDELIPMLTSKYVQSDTGNTFAAVNKLLKEGRLVLYSGTPCQIGGLLSYLGDEPENLLTVEIFCHGVPSQYAWKKYLEEYHGSETIRYVQFRYKFFGWWSFGIRFQYLHDDYYHSARSMKDPYMRSFLRDINLNDTCYNCKFKSDKTKNADFAIGDGWNINRVRSGMDDNKGVTTVLINSAKGEKFFDDIKNKGHYFPLSLEDALFVRGELEPMKKIPPVREKFFRVLQERGFRAAIEENGI